MTLIARFETALDGAARPLGLAVSGGSDSLALLHLAAEAGVGPLFCATVNHGLRPEAAAECALVADACSKLDVAHEILDWRWSGAGNLQAEARAGRYGALADWAKRRGLGTVLVGHTQDDVAETFLMRIARGSGLKGLAQMQGQWQAEGLGWARPLLSMSRGELRDYLRAAGQNWAEDASNADPSYDRVKMRQALAEVGLPTARIAETAARLAQADAALEAMTANAAEQVAQLQGRNIVIDGAALAALPEEIMQRLMSAWTAWQGRSVYPPRRGALASAVAHTLAGNKTTLNGCVLVGHKGRVIVAREAAAVTGLEAIGDSWDELTLLGDGPKDLKIRALGAEGLAAVKDWRAQGLPREALLATPSLWQGARLFAAPSLAFGDAFKLNFKVPPPYLVK